MTKKYLIGLTLIALSLWLIGSANLTAMAATTPAKTKQDPGVTKFVKIYAEASVLDNKISVPVQDVSTKMGTLSSLKQTDYAAKLKLTNQAITEITKALTLINTQNTKLASLKKTAGTIKDAKVKASALRLAGDSISVYKVIQHMIKAEKDMLSIFKTVLTLQSKGKTVNPTYLTKITALQKIITDDNAKLGPIGTDGQAAQTDFETLTGVKLAK
jgi:hypothetical protein